MTVVPFKRPPDPRAPQARRGRSEVARFALAMLVMGVVFLLLPALWSGVPQQLLAVINLVVAAVYAQRGLKILGYGWVALSLVLLYLTGAPSPVTYALSRAIEALPAG
jgi:hypothetical protein